MFCVAEKLFSNRVEKYMSATAEFGSVHNVSFVTTKSSDAGVAGALQKMLEGLAPVKQAIEPIVDAAQPLVDAAKSGFDKLRGSLQVRRDAALAKFDEAFGTKEQSVAAGKIAPDVKEAAAALLASSGAVALAGDAVARPIVPVAQTKREIV